VLRLARCKPVAAAATAEFGVDHQATAVGFQRHHQLHGQRAHWHGVIQRQHGKRARQAGRFLATFALAQPFDGRARHAEQRLRMRGQHALERRSIQPQQFAVAQRAYRARPRFAAEQADLAHAFAGTDQMTEHGGAVEYAEAAAFHQI
jgi:hypothetical protein